MELTFILEKRNQQMKMEINKSRFQWNPISILKEKSIEFLDRFDVENLPSKDFSNEKNIKVDLPYIDVFELERNYILLADGSLGVLYEMDLIEHEVMSFADLDNEMKKFQTLFEKINIKDVSIQIIFDNEKSPDFELPDYFDNPKTVAQKIMIERILMLQKNAFDKETKTIPTFQRKLYLSIKIPRKNKLGLKSKSQNHSVESEMKEQIQSVEDQILTLRLLCSQFEDTLYSTKKSKSSLRNLDMDEFLKSIRTMFHSQNFKKNAPNLYHKKYVPYEQLRDQICFDDTKRLPSQIELGGDDVMEVLSLRSQASQIYLGLMSAILKIDFNFRIVVNIRSFIEEEIKELELKENRLKWAMSAKDLLQKEEVKNSLERVAQGESLIGMSFHVILRHENTNLENKKSHKHSLYLLNNLERELGFTFVREKYAASTIFDLCLPLNYHVASPFFTGREQILLTGTIPFYLPVLGGFLGHANKVQVMQSRSGSVCYISTRTGNLNPHLALIGGSGSGKSVITSNFMMSQLASDPDTNLFIIDNKTSYTMVAKCLSKKENDYKIYYPPKSFPSIFLGNILEPDRLSIIISILKIAIILCDKNAHLTQEHQAVLSEAIKIAFEHSYKMQETYFKQYNIKKEDLTQKMISLDNILESLSESCAKIHYDQNLAQYLNNKLSPFSSTGIYGQIFNPEEQEKDVYQNEISQINLYDLDGVGNDPLMKMLATQICISDIIRIIKHKNNIGKKGVFVIDEAGFLLSSEKNEELVSFVEEAWVTFRKLNIICLGIANRISDYKTKSACKTIWNVSPNKFILPMISSEVQEARKSEGKEKPLFTEEDEEIVRSLTKMDGKYSQIYFKSEEFESGTFNFVPTGHDFWLAVSKKEDLKTFEIVKLKFGDYFKSLDVLAKYKPNGYFDFFNGKKETRVIYEHEVNELFEKYQCEIQNRKNLKTQESFQ